MKTTLISFLFMLLLSLTGRTQGLNVAAFMSPLGATQNGNNISCNALLQFNYYIVDWTYPIQCAFFLSNDRFYSSDDYLFGTYTFQPPIAPGSYNYYVSNLNLATIPGLQPGNYNIGSIVDLQNGMNEVDEFDNTYICDLPTNTPYIVYSNSPGTSTEELLNSLDLILINLPDGTRIISDASGKELKLEEYGIDGKLLSTNQGEWVSIGHGNEVKLIIYKLYRGGELIQIIKAVN
ncbi:MAG: hypothetical protein EBS07_11655 [Sphingobacteriia bacterium]|nr:hypothetical protein [Sphingobacteriia bacterium]